MLCANQAMNGLHGCGVPQDWATHRLGQELATLYHIDHAQAMAVILPALLHERRAVKRDKLLQYAERVWGFGRGEAEIRIDAALNATRDFFRRLHVPIRLGEHGLGAETVPQVLAQLERRGLTALGEQADLDLAGCERILLNAL